MGRKGDQRVLRFIDDVVSIGVAELTGGGVADEALARELATRIAHRICMQNGRGNMYVPAAIELRLTERDGEIWRKYGEDSPTARRFTNLRLHELAAEYGYTERHLYNLVALARKREAATRQPQLPGLSEPDTA